MSGEFLKLYTLDSPPDNVYFLEKGNVYFYASNMDKYSIKGNNLIIGSTEIILTHMLSMSTMRMETAITPSNSSIKKISVKKFLQGMQSFSFLMNTSIVLAQQVLLTNRVINKNISSLKGVEKIIKDLAISYYKAVYDLESEYQKRKLPWLNDILKKHQNTLTFKRGEAFSKSQQSITVETSNQLSENLVEYPRGSLICEEDTKGEEMYILQTGSIDVEIKGNKVATIDQPGTVFGEMALLLNEQRTATLRANNNTVISVIEKKRLREISEKQGDLLTSIALSLAQRHYFNIIKINTVNRALLEKTLENPDNDPYKNSGQIDKIKTDINRLKNEISEAAYKKDAEFLNPIIKILN
ncbi:MAG: cyclic nucleotide-binding domain-containing protein [Spirochaetota bacterium]